MIDRSMSICNDCARTSCVWRTTGMGIDPPEMGPCNSFLRKPTVKSRGLKTYMGGRLGEILEATIYDGDGNVLGHKDFRRQLTNYENMREMSDVEMARVIGASRCPPGVEIEDCVKHANCTDCWLDWFQSPAEAQP